jgi:hypothetical protein
MDRGGINFPNIGNALLPLMQMDRQAERDGLDSDDYLDFLRPRRRGFYNVLSDTTDPIAAWLMQRHQGQPFMRSPAFGAAPNLLNALQAFGGFNRWDD